MPVTADLAERYELVSGYAEALEAAAGGAIVLVNHFALRPEAAYAEGDDAEPCTGVEAMMRYSAVSGERLAAVGGRFLAQGLTTGLLWGEDEQWDLVVVAEYPDAAALRALLDDPSYEAAYRHRAAAVARQRTSVSVSLG